MAMPLGAHGWPQTIGLQFLLIGIEAILTAVIEFKKSVRRWIAEAP